MILIYTFSTFPYIEQLKSLGLPVVILQKLTTDLLKLQRQILETSPEVVIGIAASTNSISYIETKAINSFHKKKVDAKNFKEEYPLHISDLPFKHRVKATTSFCNWSAFKLVEFVEENKLEAKICFIHCAPQDMNELIAKLTFFKKEL